MLSTIVFVAFLLFFILLYSLLRRLFGPVFVVQKRLDSVMDKTAVIAEEKSLLQSWMERRSEKERQKLKRSKQNQTSSRLQKQLEESGLIRRYTPSQWMGLKAMILLIVGGFFLLLAVVTKIGLLKTVILESVILLVIQVLFRYLIILSIKRRKREMLRALPNTLDLITVSVEAGLSFDGAIARVMDATDNALTFEFSRALKEIRMGIERKRALRALGDRCNVKELTTVVNALIQADELGVSLSKVLRIQAEQVREIRKQAAKEKSMKAPVKMLIPLIFFIFPTIFIVILGPAVIRVMEYFK